MKKLIVSTLFMTIVTGLVGSSFGHEIFQDIMKEKYVLRSFSCKTCHTDTKDRTKRTLFAELIHQELKDKGYSKLWSTVNEDDEAAVNAFNEKISKDFEVAIEKVGQKQITFDELIRAGLLNGARLDTKRLEAMAAEKKKEAKDAKPETPNQEGGQSEDKTPTPETPPQTFSQAIVPKNQPLLLED